ncbi:MAG: hypothetical protein HND47_12645 [Chloroflexi bacterium]|nr:hypothetical protein [Chloroflexota bacterium]
MNTKKGSWIFVGLGLVALGIAILAAPSQWEGPVLVPISPGHGISALDMFGVAPILIGTGWLYVGLWQRRQRIFESIQRSPRLGGSSVFVAGLGMGLLLASSFSAFFWWYAVGAFLFGVMLIVALKVAA